MFEAELVPGRLERVAEVLTQDHRTVIPAILEKERIAFEDFLALLSESALPFLEAMAQRAKSITARRFGRNISLYAPLYVSNECINTCTYCGFSRPHRIARRTLTLPEVVKEAETLRNTGIQNVLLLTGESPKHNPIAYLHDCVQILRRYFHTVQIEVYPVSEEEYRRFHEAGVEGVTVYQETYDRGIYAQVHPAGFKRDFSARLETAERAARAGIRRISIGALLGLAPWRTDLAALGMHLEYLTRVAWRSALSLSFPRIREAAQYIPPSHAIGDRELVQVICAFRIFSPDTGISLSTRETANFRNGMLGVGVTSISAGSRTDVGGYSGAPNSTEQFVLEDHRSVSEVAAAVRSQGFQPVFKEWDRAISAPATHPGNAELISVL